MNSKNYAENLPFNLIISNKEGTITYLNKEAINNLAEDGGEALIGKKLFDCHKEESNMIIRKILNERVTNTYTIEKKGKRKIVHQFPIIENDEVVGCGEISVVIPEKIPNFKRD